VLTVIGVIANPADHAVVTEFFELFKTPWEFCRSGRDYEVLLCAGDIDFAENDAKLVVIYAGQKLRREEADKTHIAHERKETRIFSFKGDRIPIYGASVTFQVNGTGFLIDEESGQSAIVVHDSDDRVVARIGYDLFGEVRALLTVGQPVANASIPALELHIALLRDLIVASAAPLMEIPPIPDGYRFIACLTHDVDHPFIRLHKFDHTMFGFLFRATFGSILDVLRGRASVRHLRKNWAAAARLPLVHLGFAKDFWTDFVLYPKLESPGRSSFFVIPFKNVRGRRQRGEAPRRRASRYGAADVADQVRGLLALGCEVGVHGIDAWLDSSSGRKELDEIRGLTGKQNIGVRMHWLYFDEQSPAVLERAGADYDSTVGYNETVGYRAGTTQAYKPLNAARLLELPLHVMDTGLFYASYLHLSSQEATKQVGRIIDNAAQFGGTVTVNWHDRSIAPERLWTDSYVRIVDELRRKGAWFATAAEATSWFRKRRRVTFENVTWESGLSQINRAGSIGDNLPGLRLQIHNRPEPRREGQKGTFAQRFM
jgi:hypothetical protein